MINNKIVRNASWIIICRIVQAVFGLIIKMFTARYLGPSNFGIINYAASVVAFLGPLSQLGLGNVLVQETVHHPEEEGKVFGSALLLSTITSLACIVGITGFVSVANAGDTVTILVCVLYSGILIGQALELIQYWYQAKYLAKYFSIVSLCAYLVVSAYKIFLLITQKSVYWFSVTSALDYLLIAVVLLIIYKKKSNQRLRFSWAVAKRMVSVSKHYILSGMMITIFAHTDKIMLKLMLDNAVTGYYSAAVACAGMSSFVFTAILDSARPSIFESQKAGVEAFEKNVSRLYCVVIYLSLAQSLVMTFFAKWIITILYGTAFLPAIPALRLIVWYTTFSYLGAVRNIWMLAEGKQKYMWQINLFGALANVILNAALIPSFGLLGAAAASLVTQIFTNVVVGYIMKPIRRNNRLMVKGLDPRHLATMLHSLKK